MVKTIVCKECGKEYPGQNDEMVLIQCTCTMEAIIEAAEEEEEEEEIKLCSHCESENVYLFGVLNGVDVYDCKDCHKRTTY